MSYSGKFMTIKDNYMLNFNKFLSCLTKDYYDPKFAVNTVLNYVKKFEKDSNPYIEEMKQCMTFDNLFDEFCKNNLSISCRYEDNLFLFVQRYGKLQKILKKIPEKRHRNIYNLRQWICQCRYICKSLEWGSYTMHLEMAFIVYYMKANGKMSIDEAYDIILNEGVFPDTRIRRNELSYIKAIIEGGVEKYELEHNIFKASIVLPPASCALIFHGVNCFINKRSLEKSNYITYIHKISKYGLQKNQDNPVYKAVFNEELRIEQNIISRERYKVLNLSKNKYGYWLSDSHVNNILLSRYSTSGIDNMQKRVYNRLMKARKLGLASESGYTPLMEFLCILDCMNDMTDIHYDTIYEKFVDSDLAKYGFDIKKDTVKDYLKKMKSGKVVDDVSEVVYYSQFDVPPIDLERWIVYYRTHADNGKAILYKKDRFLREIEEEARLYVKGKHPVQKSSLYNKAYRKELDKAMTDVWKPMIYNKGVMERVSREVDRFDSQRASKK
jgi:hypothetical protein